MQALASGARDRFIEVETEARERAGMPPFGRLVALILSGPDLAALERAARALARVAPHYDGVQVLGPAPAPLSVLRGRHRCRFLLKARREVAVQRLVRDWVSQVKLPGKLRLQIDIDPYSFM
jgi:primosomal protein N' (replication factor Y)